MGNLLGNTFDYFLHQISFGRLGGASSRARDNAVESVERSPDAEPSG
jgi:hypothetical protein